MRTATFLFLASVAGSCLTAPAAAYLYAGADSTFDLYVNEPAP